MVHAQRSALSTHVSHLLSRIGKLGEHALLRLRTR